MNHKSFVAVPAMLLALCAVPAYALDLNIGGSAGGSASGGTDDSGVSVSFDASASAGASSGHGSDDEASASASAAGSAAASGSVSIDEGDPLLDVILLIRSSSWTKASFSGLGEVDGTTYDVSAWLNSQNSAEFEQAIEAKAAEIADLQYSLAANAEANAWLEAEGTEASAVVAVGVAADGSLAVFTHG